MKRILIIALLLGACGKAGAPDIEVRDAWARATAPGQTSAAAYMTIANRGGRADRLVAVLAPAPAEAMLHESSTADGVATMRAVEDGATVDAGATVELKPLGAHVMITGLTKPLEAGTRLPLTLRFERSGDQEVDVAVLDPTSTGPR